MLLCTSVFGCYRTWTSWCERFSKYPNTVYAHPTSEVVTAQDCPNAWIDDGGGKGAPWNKEVKDLLAKKKHPKTHIANTTNETIMLVWAHFRSILWSFLSLCRDFAWFFSVLGSSFCLFGSTLCRFSIVIILCVILVALHLFAVICCLNWVLWFWGSLHGLRNLWPIDPLSN